MPHGKKIPWNKDKKIARKKNPCEEKMSEITYTTANSNSNVK
jgi:hypothetical protein